MNIQALNNRLEEIEKKITEADLEAELFEELKKYKGDDAIISSKQIPEILESLPPRIKLGIHDFDSIIGGFGEENLVVISGPTGQGKTLFAQNLTAWLEKVGHKTLWFSFELSLSEIYERFQAFENKPVFYVPKTNNAH